MDDKDVHQLLNQVGDIHKNAEQKRRDSGERFNVFSVLRKPHDEVGLHSSFLHYLLDPQGNHDQGPIFLQAFLEQVGLTLSGDLSTIQAYREKDNIDILLRSRTEAIVIENKIYARDQKEQLQRYRDTLLAKGVNEPQIILVYLTLDGHEPDNTSELGESSLELINYADHILSWLDECVKLMEFKPRIQESLKQYKDIVRKLTGLTGTMEETEAVAQLLLQDGNYAKARLIQQAMLPARIEIHKWFWRKLEHELCNRGYELHQPSTHYNVEAYKNFLKVKKGDHPKLAFKLGEYERMDLIVKIECIRQFNTLGVKIQLFDQAAKNICSPKNFSSLREKSIEIIPESKTSTYSLATTHKWMGLDMRYFTDDETCNFLAMGTEDQANTMEHLVNALIPVFEKVKSIDIGA